MGSSNFELNVEDIRSRIPVPVTWVENDAALLETLIAGVEDLIDDVKLKRIPEGSHCIVHEKSQWIKRLIQGAVSDR